MFVAWRSPKRRPGLCSRGGKGGSGTKKFVYQKWPDEISPIVNFVLSHDGHFGLGGGGQGGGGSSLRGKKLSRGLAGASAWPSDLTIATQGTRPASVVPRWGGGMAPQQKCLVEMLGTQGEPPQGSIEPVRVQAAGPRWCNGTKPRASRRKDRGARRAPGHRPIAWAGGAACH